MMMENRERRKFLALCLGGVATASAAAVAYPVYRYLSPLSDNSVATRVTFPESDVREGEAKFFQYAGSAAVILKIGEGRLVALSAVCTHLGCIVQWQKDKQEFLCPCHAGHYSAEGAVISGPPPKPLRRIPVAVKNGMITIG
jgi:cytochrome b6-f complex iron-sulfur subunit